MWRYHAGSLDNFHIRVLGYVGSYHMKVCGKVIIRGMEAGIMGLCGQSSCGDMVASYAKKYGGYQVVIYIIGGYHTGPLVVIIQVILCGYHTRDG